MPIRPVAANAAKEFMMNTTASYPATQPLVVHFVYDEADNAKVSPYIPALRQMLSRDANYPVSHKLDIPTFTWKFPDFFQRRISEKQSQKTVLFFFVSENVAGGDARPSLENLKLGDSEAAYIIALDEKAYRVDGCFAEHQALRLCDWEKVAGTDKSVPETMLLLNVAKNLMNHLNGAVKKQVLFLSHSKKDAMALHVAESVKQFLDSNTTIGEFFDVTSIEDGEDFAERIEAGVKDSIFVCIYSDHYADRAWCSKEAILAKENNLPILGVDCLSSFADRWSPFAGNVPYVRPQVLTEDVSDMGQLESLKIAFAAMREALRHGYVEQKLGLLRGTGGIPRDAELLPSPPEPWNLLRMWRSKGQKKALYYPDPPLLTEERLLYENIGLDLRTTTSATSMYGLFNDLSIGISVSEASEVVDDRLERIGRCGDDLKNLMVDISRALLMRGASLIYGGDLQTGEGNNFTRLMVAEWLSLKEKYRENMPKLQNCIAWTLAKQGKTTDKNFMSDYLSAVIPRCIDLPSHMPLEVKNCNGIYPGDTGEDMYVWARCLTKMREESISGSQVRICAGGKRYKAKGRMPGVLEEILISVKNGKPLYLMGGFGGISQVAAELILGRETDCPAITLNGQCANTPHYGDYVKFLKDHGEYFDLEREIRNTLTPTMLHQMALNAGLSPMEYQQLLTTPFADDCVRLILKGLNNKFCMDTTKNIM